LALCGLSGIAAPAAAQVQTAVEYGFRSVWDYGYSSYFVTSSPNEIAALDGVAIVDESCCIWERSGETFDVWTTSASGALPTCRFFYPAPVDHFYTPYVPSARRYRRERIGNTRGSSFIRSSRTKAVTARSARPFSIASTTTASAARHFTA
jgi:hypothetical protein